MWRLCLGLVLASCAGGSGPDPDTGAPTDTDSSDTGDTGDTDTDTGDTDSGGDTGPALPLGGFGTIEGSCGRLDESLDTSAPSLLRVGIDFGTKVWSPDALTADGQEVIADGNLGGSSLESEAIAMEVLARCELASLIATEAEILYIDAGGKKTDLLVDAWDTSVGVSVTRAFHFPPEDPYTLAEAQDLLNAKLGDVLLSSANADPSNAWTRSMLTVVAWDAQYADMVVQAWEGLDASTRSSTVVFLVETHGEDAFIY